MVSVRQSGRNLIHTPEKIIVTDNRVEKSLGLQHGLLDITSGSFFLHQHQVLLGSLVVVVAGK